MLTGALPFAASTVQETMIKRLTDDPATLAETRPDLRFPPGLQETIAAALTRSPVDRYQSAAKFANDVAAVLGVRRASRASPWPATRPVADAKTEMLRPGAPARKRSVVPIVVGVVVVLGGAGAAAALLGRGAKTAAVPPADAVVRVDTTHPQAGTPRPQDGGAKPRIDVARAHVLLDTLVDSLERGNSVMVHDSARHIFDAPGISQKNKAYAAFVVGNALFLPPFQDRRQGCAWVKTSTELDPANTSYARILAECER